MLFDLLRVASCLGCGQDRIMELCASQQQQQPIIVNYSRRVKQHRQSIQNRLQSNQQHNLDGEENDQTDKPLDLSINSKQLQLNQHQQQQPVSPSSSTSPLPSPTSSKATKSHLCEQCGRCFSRSDMLTRHSRLHSGLKPYQCNKCQQVFSRSDHLATHERTHTGEKPYTCRICNYSACRRDMITRHLRIHRKEHSSNMSAKKSRRRIIQYQL